MKLQLTEPGTQKAMARRMPENSQFWGKLDGDMALSLSAHCLDVALCLRALCQLPAIRRVLTLTAGKNLADIDIERLAVLALLHDMGKANRGFQRKPFDDKASRAGHIRELEPLFSDPKLSAELMQRLGWSELESWFPDPDSATSYFMAIFSHHGRPQMFDGERTGIARIAQQWWQPDDELDPMQGIAELAGTARFAFPAAFGPGGDPLPAEPAFHHRFAGLVMLADWLGSHSHWFPIEPVASEERLRRDRKVIPQMLHAVGLDSSAFPLDTAPFAQRFPFPPRPLQALVDGLDPEEDANRLLIAESETGSGKTEAALHWFGKLFANGKVDSLYFALPTRVAARELYRRVVETVERWFPDPDARPLTILAVPGYAQADGVPVECRLPDESRRWTDEPDQCRWERQWAAEHPKRFLAATIAVGTVDQALLSCVQAAHAHLRSACLDRALIVVDEVHASDLYMSRLLEHLLRHHVAIGGRALLLSATLGNAARQRYTAFGGGIQKPSSLDEATALPYPCLTDVTGRLHEAGTSEKTRQVAFEPMPLALQPERIIDRLSEVLRAGARVLVVVNTVARAIALQRAAEVHDNIDPGWLFHVNGVACPYHGRFAAADRLVLDQAVSTRWSKGSSEGPLLLIGTQTLEQSLDIDADLLVSDLAPADVLLQRIGRLHRHKRARPKGLEQPRCLLLAPDTPLIELLDAQGQVEGRYKKLGYGSVYPDLRTLSLTLAALEERPCITIPDDNRWLVERATHPDALANLDDPRWQRHGQVITGEELMQALQAGTVTADFSLLFGHFRFNEAGGKVATRLGADTWRLTLEREARSPFGQGLRELQIPDHLAEESDTDTLQILEESIEGLCLQWGASRYRYSRFGLEKEEP